MGPPPTAREHGPSIDPDRRGWQAVVSSARGRREFVAAIDDARSHSDPREPVSERPWFDMRAHEADVSIRTQHVERRSPNRYGRQRLCVLRIVGNFVHLQQVAQPEAPERRYPLSDREEIERRVMVREVQIGRIRTCCSDAIDGGVCSIPAPAGSRYLGGIWRCSSWNQLRITMSWAEAGVRSVFTIRKRLPSRLTS